MKPWIIGLHLLAATLYVVRFDVVHSALFVKSHTSTGACIANLKQIESAKEQYAMDHKLENGAYIPLNGLFGRDAYMMHRPMCWQGGIFSYGPAGAEPTCSLG